MSVSAPTLVSSHPVRAWTAVVAGCTCIGASVSLMLAAGVGADPFSVFLDGAATATGLPIPIANLACASLLLAVAVAVGYRPRVVNVANIVVVSVALALFAPLWPDMSASWTRVAAASAAVLTLGFGTGLYLSADRGAGHVDAVPTALAARGLSFTAVVTVQFAVLTALGWALGGTVGAATLVALVTVGPIIAATRAVLATVGPPALHRIRPAPVQ